MSSHEPCRRDTAVDRLALEGCELRGQKARGRLREVTEDEQVEAGRKTTEGKICLERNESYSPRVKQKERKIEADTFTGRFQNKTGWLLLHSKGVKSCAA